MLYRQAHLKKYDLIDWGNEALKISLYIFPTLTHLTCQLYFAMLLVLLSQRWRCWILPWLWSCILHKRSWSSPARQRRKKEALSLSLVVIVPLENHVNCCSQGWAINTQLQEQVSTHTHTYRLQFMVKKGIVFCWISENMLLSCILTLLVLKSNRSKPTCLYFRDLFFYKLYMICLFISVINSVQPDCKDQSHIRLVWPFDHQRVIFTYISIHKHSHWSISWRCADENIHLTDG